MSVVPGGFLKQLVRESEKETKQKEPEVKEERPVGIIPSALPNTRNSKTISFFRFLLQPSKLSNDLVQQFLVPDQTPPILEAEMSLRAEQVDGSVRCALTPDAQTKQEARQEVQTQPARRSEERRTMIRAQPEEERIEEVKQAEQTEERLQPEGRQAEANVAENEIRQVQLLLGSEDLSGYKTPFPSNGFTSCFLSQVRDVWYEAGRVWYVHKDGFTPGESLRQHSLYSQQPVLPSVCPTACINDHK